MKSGLAWCMNFTVPNVSTGLLPITYRAGAEAYVQQYLSNSVRCCGFQLKGKAHTYMYVG